MSTNRCDVSECRRGGAHDGALTYSTVIFVTMHYKNAMPPKRKALTQLGGERVTLPKGITIKKQDKKRRKTILMLKRELGMGPSDSRFNIFRTILYGNHQENR